MNRKDNLFNDLKVTIARDEWQIYGYSDEYVLKAIEGTFYEARLDLYLRIEELKSEIQKSYSGEKIYWLLNKIELFLGKMEKILIEKIDK